MNPVTTLTHFHSSPQVVQNSCFDVLNQHSFTMDENNVNDQDNTIS